MRESQVAKVGNQPRTVEPITPEVEVSMIAVTHAAIDYPALSEA
jgi:hypothetical protein